jgi:hydrogenase nickel incorporation protein HypB
VQIDTGEGCRLDAALLGQALQRLELASLDLLFIEDVGALSGVDEDVGQDATVLVFSVTEGSEQAQKHPQLVAHADLVLLNKIDLVPSIPFDLDVFRASVHQINHSVPLLELSGLLAQSLEPWLRWLEARLYKQSAAVHPSITNGSHWFG